jgi:hypothetical protein
MALITIPTSIGGVSIPGMATNGPLGALFGNPFSRTDLQYPRDLQSSTRGHVVQFQINEIEPLTYDFSTENIINDISNLYGNVVEKADGTFDSIKNAAKSGNFIDFAAGIGGNIVGLAKDAAESAWSGEAINKAEAIFKNRSTRPAGTISLYMPDSLDFQYGASYNETNLMSAAETVPFIGKAVSAITQPLKSDVARLVMRGAGYALNPHQQVLFDGIDFRNYTLSFTFTPYSKDEAEQVTKIINTFKKHAAPRISEGGAGMFFIPPSTFTPKFIFNGKQNTKLNKVTESVITNIDVNYTPNGFSTHADGAPVQTTMTISFKELELITRQKIEEGY